MSVASTYIKFEHARLCHHQTELEFKKDVAKQR